MLPSFADALLNLIGMVPIDQLRPIVLAWCEWLYRLWCPSPMLGDNLAAFDQVMHLHRFAGEYWQDATGRALPFAELIDDLIDLIDRANLRGDH